MKIELYGGSDDLIEVRIDGKDKEEFYANHDKTYMGTVLVSSIGGTKAVKVNVIYDGCWSFAVGLTDEGRSLPDWTFELAQEHHYSTKLIINTKDELVTVKLEGRENE